MPTMAIELPRTSVFRDHYLDRPEETFRFLGDDFTKLGSLTRSTLPPPMSNPAESVRDGQPRTEWVFDIVDDPMDEGRVAHAEIRLRRTTDSVGTFVKPGGKPFKLRLKEAIANALEIQDYDKPV